MNDQEIIQAIKKKIGALERAVEALEGDGGGNYVPRPSYNSASTPTRRNFNPAKSAERSQKMRDAWAKRRANEAAAVEAGKTAPFTMNATGSPEQAEPTNVAVPEAQEPPVAEIPVEQPSPVKAKTASGRGRSH